MNINRRHFTLSAVATALALHMPSAEAKKASSSYVWRNVKVGGGGFIPGVVFSLAEAGLAYARSDMGGAYRWQSDEQSWIPLQDDTVLSSYFGVESIAPDPVDPNVVYAAVGMGSWGEAAMLRSSDRGATWTTTPVPYKMGGNEDGRGIGERLAIDPNHPSTLYFASRHDGLIKSTNKGRTWEKVASFPVHGKGVPKQGTHGGLSFIVFDKQSGPPGKPTPVFYIGIADPGGPRLYRTHDAGATFQPVVTTVNEQFSAVQGAIDHQGTLYVTFALGIGPNGVKDGAVLSITKDGVTHDITPPKPSGGFMGLSVQADRPGVVMVASLNRWQPGDTVYRTTNSGIDWVSLREKAVHDVTEVPYLNWGNDKPDFGWWIAALAIDPFDPNHVVYGTGATLYHTENIERSDQAKPTNWRPWVNGIEQTAVITLTSLPQGPVKLLTGFGDISGFAHRDLHDTPVQFTSPVFANTNTLEYAGDAPHIVVRSGTSHYGVGSEGHNKSTLAWSDDYGQTWHPLGQPVADAVPVQAEDGRMDLYRDAAMTVSANGQTFMVMTPVPRLSRDRGETWTDVQGLPLKARPVADRVDPNLFYAIDFDTGDWFVSTNGGEGFGQIPSQGLPDLKGQRPIWREQPFPIHTVPGQRGALWFVTRQGLYRSVDAGQVWVRIEGWLGVEQLAFGAPKPGATNPTLFAIGWQGATKGIFRSDDSGATWVRINDEHHEYARRFRTLDGDPRVYGRVYLATDGRGVLYGDLS